MLNYFYLLLLWLKTTWNDFILHYQLKEEQIQSWERSLFCLRMLLARECLVSPTSQAPAASCQVELAPAALLQWVIRSIM